MENKNWWDNYIVDKEMRHAFWVGKNEGDKFDNSNQYFLYRIHGAMPPAKKWYETFNWKAFYWGFVSGIVFVIILLIIL